MRFSLSELTKRQSKPRRKAITLRPIVAPASKASDLFAIYQPVIAAWQEALPAIEAEYARTLSAMTTDAPADLAVQISQPEAQAATVLLTVRARLARWAAIIEAWHRSRWRANVLTATRVDLATLIGPSDARETLETVIERNVGLIRSVSDETRRRVSDAVYRGLQNRTPARELARELREAVAMERRRALRIAADQTVKVTAALNEERRRQAGVMAWEWVHSGKKHPREDHRARNGLLYSDDPADAGTEYEGKTVRKPPEDKPGQLPYCGCTSRAVLIIEAIADEPVTVPSTPATAPVAAVPRPRRVVSPVAQIAAPPPQPGQGFRSPVNPKVTEGTIRVERRIDVQKRMTAELTAVAADRRYADIGRTRGRSERDIGKASFSADWTDEAVSTIAAIKPELDYLADQIGIPRLRGFKTTSGSQNADMGSGIMALSPGEFNARTAKVGGSNAEELSEKVRDQAEDIRQQQRAIQPRIEQLGEQMIAARQAGNSLRFEELRAERDPLVKKYNSLYNKRRKLMVAAGRASRVSSNPQTAWRPGDDPSQKPWSVAYYYPEGIDRVRSTLFHEFAHHVHQNLNRVGTYNRPLESRLRELWIETRNQPNHRDRLPSAYSHTNQHEWFAESFSLFVMGKKSLADPVLVELIERIFRGEFK